MTKRVADGDLWVYASTFLPPDVEALGRANGVARLREFGSVSDLLRVMLAWAQPGSSFQTAAAWASASGVARITPEALFYRVRHSEGLLKEVMEHMLARWRSIASPRRLVVVDATVLAGPGSSGTDWRVHMLYDPRRAVPCGVELTDSGGGESLARHDLRRGDLVLGDRGYGHFRGFVSALSKGADVLVRVEPGQMKVFEVAGERTHLEILARGVPTVGTKDFELVWHGPGKDCRKVRLIGVRTKKGEVCWLATNLGPGALPSEEAAELYGVRWQIELMFKRMKSLLEMDEMRSREGPTAKAFVYAKLITAFLALRLTDESGAFSPYGYEVRSVRAPEKPVARAQAGPRRARGRGARTGQVDPQGELALCA